ncbi:MAG TPA: hypothetical protein VKU86_14275 [Acidimicrobiales bacterium]|nr:hypothetical protein [Acidimicrobiales bacterium]
MTSPSGVPGAGKRIANNAIRNRLSRATSSSGGASDGLAEPALVEVLCDRARL